MRRGNQQTMHRDFEIIYDFLALRDQPVQKCDLIIGFGHFDLRIPDKCAQLYQQNVASRMLFTGGIGAGSAGFKHPEAVEFKNQLPEDIPPGHILLESKSTNTSQNIEFSLLELKKNWPDLDIHANNAKIIAVATPVRQRRVYQTLIKYFPAATICNQPPGSDFKTDQELFIANGEHIEATILGEMERLIDYPAKGWIKSVEIPAAVMNAYLFLKKNIKS